MLWPSLLSGIQFGLAQHVHEHTEHEARLNYPFIQNLGQWESQTQYKVQLPSTTMFLEKDKFTYSFYDGAFLRDLHGKPGKSELPPTHTKAHGLKVHFKGINPKVKLTHENASSDYRNYYLGNDPARWATHVHSYKKVIYDEVYSGIDLAIYEKDHVLKYDFMVAPGQDPSKIQLVYEGADNLKLEHGNLYVTTSVSELIEHRPYAYQIVNGKQKRSRVLSS